MNGVLSRVYFLRFPPERIAKEHFFCRESKELLDLIDQAARKGRNSRGQAFSDFLEIVVCTLSGGEMEEQYLSVVKRYAEGEPGKRGIDMLAQCFARLVQAMEETRADILGDLFQGGITYGENGQFFTPDTVADLMAQLVGHDEKEGEGDGRKTVADPCCGSGRMLLSAAKVNPHREFIGQDIDLRCVRMTAINLALRNLYGLVCWGNSLTQDQRLAYRTGFNGKGFIQEVQLERAPESTPAVPAHRPEPPPRPQPERDGKPKPNGQADRVEQGSLFDE